jgi:hypothetical protein
VAYALPTHPLADALPAIQEHLGVIPDDGPLGVEELRELLEVTRRYVRVSEVLLRYAEVVGGKPSMT